MHNHSEWETGENGRPKDREAISHLKPPPLSKVGAFGLGHCMRGPKIYKKMVKVDLYGAALCAKDSPPLLSPQVWMENRLAWPRRGG